MHLDHDDGHGHTAPTGGKGSEWRRILWIAFLVNAVMFFVELAAGLYANSVSLQADAIDFFSDATNYAISLSVLGMGFAWQTRAAFLKGSTLIVLGLWVLGTMLWNLYRGTLPEAPVMGVFGVMALVANVGVALLLYRFREGDANMRSVWICTRNDAVGNIAVLFAALGVFGTATGYPDFIVATMLAGLSLHGGWLVLRQALSEHRDHQRSG